jgi:hypothetical protein
VSSVSGSDSGSATPFSIRLLCGRVLLLARDRNARKVRNPTSRGRGIDRFVVFTITDPR